MQYLDDTICYNENEIDFKKLKPNHQISEEITTKFKKFIKSKEAIFATALNQLET